MTDSTPRGKRFVIWLLLGCAFVAAGVWLSSGTMAPYASTLYRPWIVKPCNYLLNTDNSHFEATFKMLDGRPRDEWKFSIVARRILFPLLAFPAMKTLGFLIGGVVTSAILQVAALVGFVIYIRRRIGEAAAYAAIALLATYPGTFYWGGLPYSYAAIVPACLGAMIILIEIERQPDSKRVALLAFALGVLLLAYDLLPFFGPPLLAMLVLRKRWKETVIAAVLIATPTVVNNLLLYTWAELPLRNQNTQAYADVVQAYMNPFQHTGGWRKSIVESPRNLFVNYFTCNFFFLPALFLVLYVLNRFTLKLRLTFAEKGVLTMTLLLFAFLNLSPPNEGWQFRGIAVARIYQPVFVVFLVFALRMVQAVAESAAPVRQWVIGLAGVTAVLNALIVLGPVLHLRLADHAYFQFYRHAQRPVLSENLAKFGRRPLGICDTSITIQNDPPRKRGQPKLSPEQRKIKAINKLKKDKKRMTKAKKQRLRLRAATQRAATQRAATRAATTAATRPSTP
jgi:hypothetical protein